MTPAELDDAARDLYESANALLRYYTAAAWTRWEDVDADCRAAWLAEAARRADR